MGWNYRVYRRKINDDPGGAPYFYSIHEAYYAEPEEVSSYSKNPIAPVASSLDELRWSLEKMLAALDKPVLDYEEDES